MIEPITKDQHRLPSNRSFGFLMVLTGFIFSAWSYTKSLPHVAINAACGASMLFLITIFIPNILHPFNWFWYRLGLLIGKIVNPIIMGFIFFLLITPIAIISRFSGRDPLGLKKSNKLESFWIEREPEGFKAESFKNQY